MFEIKILKRIPNLEKIFNLIFKKLLTFFDRLCKEYAVGRFRETTDGTKEIN